MVEERCKRVEKWWWRGGKMKLTCVPIILPACTGTWGCREVVVVERW